MIWITGDKHGDFEEVDTFCREWNTVRSDVLIILGDAGINYFTDARSTALHQHLAQLPITLFCVHGNHEARPETLSHYQLQPAFGGQVYVDPRYPNQLFPVDGQIYTIGFIKALVIGGAYSVDKYMRLRRQWAWFEDEQPSEEIRKRTEAALDAANWTVDVVLSHTCPSSLIPFTKIPPLAPDTPVDDSTERWLETLKQRLTYKQWYFGHYHIDEVLNNAICLYHHFMVFDI